MSLNIQSGLSPSELMENSAEAVCRRPDYLCHSVFSSASLINGGLALFAA